MENDRKGGIESAMKLLESFSLDARVRVNLVGGPYFSNVLDRIFACFYILKVRLVKVERGLEELNEVLLRMEELAKRLQELERKEKKR